MKEDAPFNITFSKNHKLMSVVFHKEVHPTSSEESIILQADTSYKNTFFQTIASS